MQMDFSVGAIGAASIAGVVSFLGLVISKEQKISDFRQAWIDSLRSEITTYLTNINAITDALTVKYKSQVEKVSALSPLYSNLNAATFSITLRLNPDEKHSAELLECMNDFNNLAADDSKMIASNVRPIELSLIKASKILLKYEWKRVKRGELVFIGSKFIAAILAIVTFVAIFSSYFSSDGNTSVKQNAAVEDTTPIAIKDARTTQTSHAQSSSSAISSPR